MARYATDEPQRWCYVLECRAQFTEREAIREDFLDGGYTLACPACGAVGMQAGPERTVVVRVRTGGKPPIIRYGTTP